MAKRNYSVMKKVEPSVLRFTVNLPTLSSGSSTSASYLDISQIVSLLNRRFYRQGLNWAVSDIKHLGSTSDGSAIRGFVSVEKCPNTWVFHNAWKKSFEAWRKMVANATDESGSQSIKGKFLDFKIYADAGHHTDGFAGNLLPADVSGAPYTSGQWQPSELQIPVQNAVTDTRELIAVGPNSPGAGASGYDAVSVIQGYADSRALPSTADPNVPADANDNWMVQLFDNVSDQDQDVIADLEVMGNNPPYPFEGDQAGNIDTQYPGGESQAPTLQFHDFQYITGTTIGGHTHLAGGLFPCGLMKVQTVVEGLTGDTQLFQGLVIELCPGNHRGYLAESMS